MQTEIRSLGIAKRLKAFFEENGLSNMAELARTLNLSYDKVASYLSGKAEPGSQFWRTLIGKFPDANVAFLLTGIEARVALAEEEADIPIVDRIPAGPLAKSFGEEGVIGHIGAAVKDPDAFALMVTGASMSPEIQESDIVICSPRASFVNGKIYAVVVEEGEQSLKRVRYDLRSKAYALIPSNKEFPTLYVPETQVLKLVRVVEVRRDLQ